MTRPSFYGVNLFSNRRYSGPLEGGDFFVCDDCHGVHELYAVIPSEGISSRRAGWEFDQDDDLENAAYIWCGYCRTVSEMDLKGGTVVDTDADVN